MEWCGREEMMTGLERSRRPRTHKRRKKTAALFMVPRLALWGILVMIVASWGYPHLSPAFSETGFKQVAGDCNLQFPRDHGAHPGYQTEWWYYTGNLESDAGDRFGFQLTFFRRQTAPLEDQAKWPKPASPWRTLQIYFAHSAISDLSGGGFTHHERVSRGAMDLAGARQDSPETTEIFLGDWSARIEPTLHLLSAGSEGFDVQLSLKPVKEPVRHGIGGYSLKGSSPDRASCYYSLTRMEASGFLVLAGEKTAISGTAWMDHEFSSAPLEPIYVGWDWFSLQLSDKTELMIYLLRTKDGSHGPSSSGTHVDTSGAARHLGREDFTVEVLDSWKSPRSGARYPSGWRIRVHPLQMDLTIRPNLQDQELRTEGSTRVTYWEGSVEAEGTAGRLPVQAVGYAELTGYAHPLEALH